MRTFLLITIISISWISCKDLSKNNKTPKNNNQNKHITYVYGYDTLGNKIITDTVITYTVNKKMK
jgi:hypothetical protein